MRGISAEAVIDRIETVLASQRGESSAASVGDCVAR
jgi:hypothetical protein